MSTLAALESGFTTRSAGDTRALAASLARELPADIVLALDGPMGAGKTTFVQGLAEGWGVTDPVTSPTFAVFHIYRGTRQLVHADGYRLNAGEANDLLIEDFLLSPWNLVVEWPDRFGDALPSCDYVVTCERLAPEEHRFRLAAKRT